MIVEINNKHIVVKGIGKLFYQDGIPIAVSIEIANSKCLHVSILHIADELLKEGWNPKNVFNKLQEEKDIDINNIMDLKGVKDFIFADYNTQREMLFNYLFNSPIDASKLFKELIRTKKPS